MEDGLKPSRKKKVKKESDEMSASFQALAKLTSSDVIRQVKMGMSKIAPLEPESEAEEPQAPEDLSL